MRGVIWMQDTFARTRAQPYGSRQANLAHDDRVSCIHRRSISEYKQKNTTFVEKLPKL